MDRYKTAFWSLLAVLTVSWLMADTFLPEPLTYFSFRHVFTQYSGVMAIGVMSLAMILATRPTWLEPFLGGLDKAYRLHKWLGITALVMGSLHWWMAKGTKWMVGWGWLTKPERNPRSEQVLPPLQDWLNSQRGLAEDIGEWAFYAIVLFIVLALVKRFPYSLFRKTHIWIAIAYLFLVFHSVVLMNYDYWSQPIGWVSMLLLVSGSISGIWLLTGKVGSKRIVKGKIAHIKHYQNTLEGQIKLDPSKQWQGHKAGQFAFVTSNAKEGPHPYTIASAWNPKESQLTFMIKELGDWTQQLKTRLKIGTEVTIEGPYGCFDFDDKSNQQIWVAAGIGITPFIARLEFLIQRNKQKHIQNGRRIDLFFCLEKPNPDLIRKVDLLAKTAGVNLYLTISSLDGRLSADRVRDQIVGWSQSSIWFCGPKAFGKSLRKDFRHFGLSNHQIHQELFEMR
jgi:predicted ferric reductase